MILLLVVNPAMSESGDVALDLILDIGIAHEGFA